MEGLCNGLELWTPLPSRLALCEGIEGINREPCGTNSCSEVNLVLILYGD